MSARTMGARCFLVALLALLPTSCERRTDAPQETPTAAETVPDWFRPDPTRPYAIFDAWRGLSTREAAVYLHCHVLDRAWTVLAGVLKDEDGRPLPLTPIGIYYHGGLRGYGARFRTDAKGCFLVYSPYSLNVRSNVTEAELAAMTSEERSAYMNERACKFTACPGYPYSELSFRYAASKDDFRRCRAKLVMEAADRAFYELTCERENTFDEDGFREFQRTLVAEDEKRKITPYRSRPRCREGPTKGLERTVYAVRVVSPEGRGIPKAMVTYTANDGRHVGNLQTVETDENGRCSLEEYLEAGRSKYYYDGVQRDITLDAPGYGVGPVECGPIKREAFTIRMRKPASVSGRLLDHNGYPIWADVAIEYEKDCRAHFELCAHLRPDGRFAFDRIMPGESFRIVARRGSGQTTPMAPVETGYFTLQPGEERVGIELRVPLASAVRGIIVGEDGVPVSGLHDLAIMFEDGRGRGSSEPLRPRFGFSGLGAMPFRIRAEWFTFSDWIALEPGELRFVQLTLQKPSKARVSFYVKELRDGAAFVRENAACMLGKIGPDAAEAVSDLTAALQDGSWHVREAAAEALGGIGPSAKEAVPALIRALEDESRSVRFDAAHALGDIGPGASDAAPALTRLLERGEENERAVAAWALGKIGPAGTGVVPGLAKALRDENWDVREAAASSLGKLGPSAGKAAAALVGLLRDAAPLLTERLWDDYRRAYSEAEGALAKIGEPAVPILKGALRDELPAVRAAAAGALEKIRTAQGKEPER